MIERPTFLYNANSAGGQSNAPKVEVKEKPKEKAQSDLGKRKGAASMPKADEKPRTVYGQG